MTGDILQTDVILARQLLADQRTDEEIIAALVQRRVDPGKAGQLVADLRQGRPISTQPATPTEFTLPRRRSRSRSQKGESAQRNTRSAPERTPRSRPASSSRNHAGQPPVRMILIGVAVVAIIVVAGTLFHRFRNNLTGPTEPGDKPVGSVKPAAAQPGSAKNEVPAEPIKPGTLVLELQPDGLHVGGKPLSAGNVLGVVGSLLGAATRTNQIAQTGATVYAYDNFGLLIYVQRAGGTNSIVLDCEATGGSNGTTSPFAGTLKVEGQSISLDTDPEVLVANEKLGLKKSPTGSRVWSGRYQNVDLVFAYLKSAGHLSLIWMDLKQ